MSLSTQYSLVFSTIKSILHGAPAFYTASPVAPFPVPRTTVYPANFIDFTGADPFPLKQMNRGPGDFPLVVMMSEGDDSDPGAMNSSLAYNGTFQIQPKPLSMVLYLVGADEKTSVVESLSEAAHQAFYAAGPVDLGLANVWKWGPWQSRTTIMEGLKIAGVDVFKGNKRVCKITCPITLLLDSSVVTS